MNQTDFYEIEKHERDFIELLSDVQDQLKSFTKWFVLSYTTIFFMIVLSLIDWSQENYTWIVVYAILGLFNLFSIKRFHKNKKDFMLLEYELIKTLFIIKKIKERHQEGC